MAARILGPKACLSCGEYCNLRGQQRVLGSFPLSCFLFLHFFFFLAEEGVFLTYSPAHLPDP